MRSVTAPICSIKVWRVTVTLKQDLPALSETETRLGTSLMISDVQKVFLTVRFLCLLQRTAQACLDCEVRQALGRQRLISRQGRTSKSIQLHQLRLVLPHLEARESTWKCRSTGKDTEEAQLNGASSREQQQKQVNKIQLAAAAPAQILCRYALLLVELLVLSIGYVVF